MRNDFECDPLMTVVPFYTAPVDLWQEYVWEKMVEDCPWADDYKFANMCEFGSLIPMPADVLCSVQCRHLSATLLFNRRYNVLDCNVVTTSPRTWPRSLKYELLACANHSDFIDAYPLRSPRLLPRMVSYCFVRPRLGKCFCCRVLCVAYSNRDGTLTDAVVYVSRNELDVVDEQHARTVGSGQGSGGGPSGRGSGGGQRTRTQDIVQQAGSGERSMHRQADKVPVIDYKDKFWMLDWVGEAGQAGSGLMLYVVSREDIRPIGGIQSWAGRDGKLATFELTMQLNGKGHRVAETNHVVLMWRNHKGYGKSLVDVFNPDPDSRLRLPDLRQVLAFFDTNSVEGHRPVAHKEDTITELKSVMSSARPTVGAIMIRQPSVTTPAVQEERQHALVSTSVVPRAGQIVAKGPAHAQAPPPAPKKFRSVGVKEPLSVLHDIVRTSSMCAEPMYGAVHRGVQPLYFGDPGEGSSGEGSQREEEEEEEGSQKGNDSENTISDRERRGLQSKKMSSGNFAPTGTGGKRGQCPSGGASGEGGEHPSGDEGGGDEGGCDKGGDKGGSGEGGGTSKAPGYSQPTTGTSEGQAHHHHERSASGVGGHIDIRGLPQVKLFTAVEQIDEGCDGGQSVTTTLTTVTMTDNEWCDGSGASVFPVGEKGNIGSPQGHMWMSMDILPYGLGSQGRLRASLDKTMYLAETEQQLEAHTPLDEETLRGDLEIPAEFQSSKSEEKAQRGSREAGIVTGYQEEAMLAEEMEPGGEPNSPFDEDIPDNDFDTSTGGSQDSPIVFDTAGKNDTLEGLVAKEAIQVPDIEEDEGHIVLTTPTQ
ncbi:hypothetical protein CBR_g30200 [Chara braunii]|uniref:Uncharacterized protein n=1 Tax=Chara braunii TaxID=69332 RepID=A0A388LCB6_CHABU|nr:hypothetical protein CBR_g30200 [Chara braunii]|eukprot:GBG79936.1 hypothetical protein CBR_g30200 [Chara braunii]